MFQTFVIKQKWIKLYKDIVISNNCEDAIYHLLPYDEIIHFVLKF